jgi:phosphotransacetylase
MNQHEHNMPDPEKIKEILDVVSEKIPGLLKELSGLLYSPKSAKQYAEAAATFYKELKGAGMTDEQAFELTSQYLSTLNFGKMMGNFGQHQHG